MAMNDYKAVKAFHKGKPVRGIYKREAGTFEIKKGAVKITVPNYEYSFDFTVAGKRHRSVFGQDSDFGKINAKGVWESEAIERAVETLLKYKNNAKTGEGPTSITEEQEILRKEAEENARKEKRKILVKDLSELFLTDIAVSAPGITPKKPRTIKEYRQNLYRDVIPAIGERKAETIEREDIAEIIDKIVARGSIIQANRTLAACSRLFNWALSKGRVRYNPCAQMKKYNEKPRDRVLTEPEQKQATEKLPNHDEIKTLWLQLEDKAYYTEARVLMLCVLTGARPGEICNMKWEDIDRDNWWTVHQDKIKTNVSLECLLTQTAIKVIEPRQPKGYVFTLNSDPEKPLPVSRLSKFVRNYGYFNLEEWQPRDLRRTFTTLATGFEFSDLIINKAQARKDSSVIRVHYDKRHYYNELRQLFETVEREILRIIGKKKDPAKVVKIINKATA